MEQRIVDNFLEKVQDIKVIKDLIEKLSSYRENVIYANDIIKLLSNMRNVELEKHFDLGITSFNYNSGDGIYTLAISTDFDIVIYANYLSAYIEEILAAISSFFGTLIKEVKLNNKEMINNFNRMFKDAFSRLLDIYMSNSYIEITLDNRGKVIYIHTYSDIQKDIIEEFHTIISNILSMLNIIERFLIIKV